MRLPRRHGQVVGRLRLRCLQRLPEPRRRQRCRRLRPRRGKGGLQDRRLGCRRRRRARLALRDLPKGGGVLGLRPAGILGRCYYPLFLFSHLCGLFDLFGIDLFVLLLPQGEARHRTMLEALLRGQRAVEPAVSALGVREGLAPWHRAALEAASCLIAEALEVEPAGAWRNNVCDAVLEAVLPFLAAEAARRPRARGLALGHERLCHRWRICRSPTAHVQRGFQGIVVAAAAA
mmetsp:Transcript_96087/g.299253  ORF Transcript_96087/g.299253 Transcript_96087/m.299253 type:complete len:233 (-) Transcript_96087:1051-1749(-)